MSHSGSFDIFVRVTTCNIVCKKNKSYDVRISPLKKIIFKNGPKAY